MPDWWNHGQRYTSPDSQTVIVRVRTKLYIRHSTEGQKARFYELAVLQNQSGGATGRFLLEDYITGWRFWLICTNIACNVQPVGGRVINYSVESSPGDIGTPLLRADLDRRQMAVSLFQVAGAAQFICFSGRVYRLRDDQRLISRAFLVETGNDRRQRITELKELEYVSPLAYPEVSLAYPRGTFLVPQPGQTGNGNWNGHLLRQLPLANYQLDFDPDGMLSRFDVKA